MKAILSIIMCILLFGCASTQQIRSQEAITGPSIEERGLPSLFFDGERGITWLSIKNTYLLQFLPDCQYELPPEDFTKKIRYDVNLQERFQYRRSLLEKLSPNTGR